MPLRDEIAEPSTQSSGLENFTATSLKTLEKSSVAFADEITDDLVNHPAKFLERSAYGAGIGFGATWLLKKPQLALIAGGGLAAWQSAEGLISFNEFARKAINADTEQARERISTQAGLRLGHSMAVSVEMLPAMGFGAYQGSKLLGTPPLYQTAGAFAKRELIMPAKDRLAFLGPGTSRLSADLARADGSVDALGVGRLFSGKHGWSGVETGQSLDLASGKISRKVVGTSEDIAWLPGSKKPGVVTFHTHGPAADVGPRPSVTDIIANRGLGIISKDDHLAFFVGQAEEMATARGAAGPVSMRAIVLNEEKQSAVRITGLKYPDRSWQEQTVAHLDFAETVKALRRVDGKNPWATMAEIPVKPALSVQEQVMSTIAHSNWGLPVLPHK